MDKVKNLIYIAAVCFLWACGSNGSRALEQQYIPVEPDYKNADMWVCHLNDKNGEGADVFYIPSTWEYDWTTSNGVLCRYADVSNEQHCSNMAIEMNKVAKYMADGNNFYSPYYRHITLDTWATLDEDYITRQYESVSLTDVKHAFDHFIKNWNKGRPFVLAGFSQGGKSVVELMKYMPEDIRKYMVAAYVLGYKVTPDDVAVAPWIVAAKGASDVGVTICYNSVSDVKYIKPVISSPAVMCINPVNWRTDSTPAILNDSITVTLNTEHNVLVLDGYDGSHLPNILNILNVGDYHSIEPWLYDQSLRANIKQRIKAFRENN
ncbi:MAG: DUF3089 domain-containing protein [Bacteroidaceae bacterium]|nr:DUF3089 domain-containing protein [Bacteroidaceae bacterium]